MVESLNRRGAAPHIFEGATWLSTHTKQSQALRKALLHPLGY